ncbi:class I SAM-dependent methyltransferase [Spirulina subsalsa FACHB-351]|uniref:Class I SAM-dependent methyltransferase n=1 Tax=Spirulina subsalsa FACHB-351 TaxID=234711 RepID=A0ABT3L6S5_9CYAN|nr:class I SAM-dependent methyltransferase [Spirulina subsalsa]MCW6037213.1 class I SAM-dependent methyltransferase [Spirulina subsalsa FACHB-351]
MTENDAKLLEQLREQFDFGPYPKTPLDVDPKTFPSKLYINNLITAYYLRNQKVIHSQSRTILDVGCGSGFTSLILAEANPEAKIIGIDISEKSIELAQKRAEYYNKQEQCEFFVLSVDDIPSLSWEFDYINCDEVLYLLPDPLQALQVFKQKLKPSGIIRANLHSAAQRVDMFNLQKFFSMLGFMDKNIDDNDIDVALQVIHSLQDNVPAKKTTWSPNYEKDPAVKKEFFLCNYLLKGDKGYNINQMFDLLRQSDLEFIRMVDWRQWQWLNLFKEPDNLPVVLGVGLVEKSPEEQLRIFELLSPIHRLLDFWCGHPGEGEGFVPVSQWSNQDWYSAIIHLHPQFNTEKVRTGLRNACRTLQDFTISDYVPIAGGVPTSIDVTIAACLLPPLLESPQSLGSLIERWKTLRPINLATLEPTTDAEAFDVLKSTLTGLEAYGYVLLERA